MIQFNAFLKCRYIPRNQIIYCYIRQFKMHMIAMWCKFFAFGGDKGFHKKCWKLIESWEQEVASSESCRAEVEVKERPVRDQLTVRAQVHLLYRESRGRWAQGGGAPPASTQGEHKLTDCFVIPNNQCSLAHSNIFFRK